MKAERRFKPAESGRKSIKQVQLIPDDSVDISDATFVIPCGSLTKQLRTLMSDRNS